MYTFAFVFITICKMFLRDGAEHSKAQIVYLRTHAHAHAHAAILSNVISSCQICTYTQRPTTTDFQLYTTTDNDAFQTILNYGNYFFFGQNATYKTRFTTKTTVKIPNHQK